MKDHTSSSKPILSFTHSVVYEVIMSGPTFVFLISSCRSGLHPFLSPSLIIIGTFLSVRNISNRFEIAQPLPNQWIGLRG